MAPVEYLVQEEAGEALLLNRLLPDGDFLPDCFPDGEHLAVL